MTRPMLGGCLRVRMANSEWRIGPFHSLLATRYSLFPRSSIASVAAELRHQIGGDRAHLIGCRHAPALVHVADDRLSIPLLPFDHGHPLQGMADRATRLHQLLAGAARKRDRLGGG